MMRAVLTCLLSCFFLLATANKDLGFISPVKHKLRISGSFAEFRTNHFHAGIDIKSSKGRIGDPLYSISDGHISRIKVMSGGYGNVLYIEHPSGYTSVYAHMDSFLPEVAAYLKEIQYEVESFEVECYLPADKFKVKKGQRIGVMGTTGRSTGPHLHFELRETKTERPVNPYLFGIAPEDNIEPQLQNIAIYDLDQMDAPQRLSIHPLILESGNQYILKDTLFVESEYVGLSVQMFDRMNGASNKNEVYACSMTNSAGQSFSWKGDRFDFDETKYVNARLDFQRKKDANQNLQLLFSQSCNQLEMLESNAWNGKIHLSKGRTEKIHLEMSDVSGNKVQADIYIKKRGDKKHQHDILDKNVICDKDTLLLFNDVSLSLSKSTVYHNEMINVKRAKKSYKGVEYPTIKIGENTIAAHRFYQLTMKLPSGFGQKTCLVKIDKKGKLKNFGGVIKDGFINVELDEFGTFLIYEDFEAPKIETVRFSSNLSKYDSWKFLITDALDPDGRLDDLSYKAQIDGRWALLNYDKKNDLIVFSDFDRIKPTDQKLVITVWDNQKNVGKRSYSIKNTKN